jgi:hypothetical protein
MSQKIFDEENSFTFKRLGITYVNAKLMAQLVLECLSETGNLVFSFSSLSGIRSRQRRGCCFEVRQFINPKIVCFLKLRFDLIE